MTAGRATALPRVSGRRTGPGRQRGDPGVRLALCVAVVGIALRLLLAWFAPGNFDLHSYEIDRRIVAAGGNVYRETANYNYAPFWAWILGGIGAAADLTGLPFAFLVRAALTLVDVVTAFLLYVAALRIADRRRAATAAALFLANPVSIAVTGFQGQFDCLALAFVVAAVAVQLGRNPRLGPWLVAAGVLLKQTVAPELLYATSRAIRSPGRRLVYAALVGVAFLLTLVPFALTEEARNAIGQQVIRYTLFGLANGSGVPHPAVVAIGILRLAALLGIGLLAHRLPIHRAALLGMLVAGVASGAMFANQYTVWPIALGSLVLSPGYFVYTAATGLAILGSDAYFAWPIGVGFWLPWLAALAWTVELAAASGLGARLRAAGPGLRVRTVAVDVESGHAERGIAPRATTTPQGSGMR